MARWLIYCKVKVISLQLISWHIMIVTQYLGGQGHSLIPDQLEGQGHEPAAEHLVGHCHKPGRSKVKVKEWADPPGRHAAHNLPPITHMAHQTMYVHNKLNCTALFSIKRACSPLMDCRTFASHIRTSASRKQRNSNCLKTCRWQQICTKNLKSFTFVCFLHIIH